MKIIEGDLILTENTTFNESIEVRGNIKGNFNLTVEGNICAWNINAENIDAKNINARDIDAWNINAENIDASNIKAGDIYARNINALDIEAKDISFHAFCIAYNKLKCKSIKGRRENNIFKCLDSEVEYI